MRGNGKNALLDEEPRSFSLEEAFLTSKNYKIIFCIALIVVTLRMVLFVLMWREWKGNVIAALFSIGEFILDLTFVLIPVVFVVRIIFTRLLKKKIDKLDQEIRQRSKTASQQNSA
ncbi:hypothetical protein [Bartonella grahamii]|uniref:hypothetical protein n=1 Tax=Bartonella grahamii TaxID=33045 RepID=UPI00059FC18E|nr:hypothetical protein [Bartonella grahamii]